MLSIKKKFSSESNDTYTLVLCDQDKYDNSDPDYIIGERQLNHIPRIDESVLVDLQPYYVEGISHDLDGINSKVYLTIRAVENVDEQDED